MEDYPFGYTARILAAFAKIHGCKLSGSPQKKHRKLYFGSQKVGKMEIFFFEKWWQFLS